MTIVLISSLIHRAVLLINKIIFSNALVEYSCLQKKTKYYLLLFCSVLLSGCKIICLMSQMASNHKKSQKDS